MADFKIQKTGYTPVTCVPDDFIETYMPMANGDYVKIYLYLCNKRMALYYGTKKITKD